MKKKFLFHVFILTLFINLLQISSVSAQQGKSRNFTVSGYVTDGKSSETMINASVYDANTMKGSVTNNFGYYTLRLGEGPVNLKASYVGYVPFEASFNLHADTVINIKLTSSVMLDEVVVVGQAIENNVTSTRMSAVEIPVMQMKKIPALFGETDVIKTLQLLPGVQSGTEGSAGMYVRGGGPDENLILLDGVPLYNVNHAMGFFSAFNADAIKNVTLYKGNFPARFGGRLSSVVDVSMKDGDMYEYHGNASIGLIAAKVNVEGPIVKDKTSFNLSFRRTYYDLFTAPIVSFIAKRESNDEAKAWAGYYFYDFNLKLNHKFSDKDRLFFSLYSGDDKVYARISETSDHSYETNDGEDWYQVQTRYEQQIKINWKWGNRIAALRWNHIVSPKLFMNVTASHSRYRHLIDATISGEETRTVNGQSNASKMAYSLGLNSGIFDYCLRSDFDYKPHENHDIKFGAAMTYHSYEPSSTAIHMNDIESGYGVQMDTIIGDAKLRALETDLYAEDNWNINNFFKMNLGLHYATFTVEDKTYHSIQPRASLRVLADENLSFKAGYAYMSQYVHLLSSNTISLPTDLWVPVTDKILPMNAHQMAVGAFYDWKDFEFSLEGYYKMMDNVLEYKDGASFFSLETAEWQNKVVMGEGHSYGVEFLVRRNVGKTTGWIGYTWSKTERLFNRPGQELNFGEPFPAKYDRRHDLNIVVMHQFSDRFDMSGTWVYSTGNCATLAYQNYYGLPNNYGNFPQLGYVTYRNNYRFNSYQRLDIAFNWHKQKKHGERTWTLSVYNVLCHNNPFLVYVDSDYVYDPVTEEYEYADQKLKQVCIFPIIPTFSYSFKF